MRILLTGATGYLGSHLAQRLIVKGHTLGCTIRDSEQLGYLKPVKEKITLLPVERLEDEVVSFHPEIVINTAGTYSRNGITERNVVEGNLLFPLRVMQIARDVGINRWINTATSLPPILNTYAFSKYQFSQWGAYYADKNKFTFVNLVLEHFYGVDMPEEYFLSWVIKKLVCDAPLELTVGTQKRDFIYIDDVLSVYEVAISHAFEEGFEEIEVGTGVAPTIREVVEYLKKITHSKSILNFGAIPMRKGEPDSHCNTEQLLKLGTKPFMDWHIGMELLLNFTK